MPTPRERALEAALKESQEIAKKDLTDEELVDFEKRVEIIEGMKAAVTQEKELRAAIEGVIAPATEDEEPEGGQRVFDQRRAGKTLGDLFTKSEAYEWLKDTQGHGDSPQVEFGFKAEPTVVGEGTALSGLVVAQRVNTIEGLASFPLSVADLIPTIQTNANAIQTINETSETSSIAMVAEDAEKPNFTLAAGQTTDEVEVLAGMGAVTRQALEDVPFIAGFINARLTYKLRQVEENQILLGNGTSPNLDGIQHRTTSTLSGNTATVLDDIYKAADKCLVDGGYPADGLVVTPADWQPIRLSKDDVSRYYGEGPFGQILGDTLWGLRVVKSTQETAGKILVGAFGQAALLARNGGLTIRTSDSHGTYFKFNRVAVLIEERLALAVPAPLAFCVLTVT